MNKALIIMNVQTDFFMGGKRCIYRSLNIIPIINRLKKKFKYVFFISNWYTKKAKIFKKGYRKHCLQHTPGAKIHTFVIVYDTDIIIKKGTNDKYISNSAFYHAKELNDQTNLNHFLYELSIDTLYFCGSGVFHSILDAYKFRYRCCYVYDACVGKKKRVMVFLKKIGVKFVNSDTIQ